MTGIRVSAALRLAYLKALFAQPISVLDKLPSGQTTDLITTQSNTIQTGISDKLAILVQSAALIISAYIIAFVRNWTLTLLSSSTMLFIAIVYSFLTPGWIKMENSLRHANEKASTIAGEVFGAIRTVLSLGAEESMRYKYGSWIDEARRRGLSMSALMGGQFSPAFFAIYCNFALTFWYGIRMYNDGRIDSVGTVVIVLFSVLIIVSSLGNLVVPSMGILKAATASTGFWKVIDAPKISTEGAKDPEVSSNEDLTFEKVVFAYPSRAETAVLQGLDLVVPANKITAIVGPSGCGKSTVVGLLERWYHLSDVNERIFHKKKEQDKDALGKDKTKKKTKKMKKNKKGKDDDKSDNSEDGPVSNSEVKRPILQNSGSIRVGKHNVESLDLKWWRSQIGLVQQEPFLFNDTIYENVAMGLIGSSWEHEDAATKRKLVEEACEEAFANEFIKRLPNSYDTKTGESGIKLSGGQRQRIAIARSIIKRPKILILDEATSAIDVKGEKIVQAALDRVSKNRTTITIAHRLSTIKKADHIVVLKEGACVEQGTHQSLLEDENGVYYNLVHAQHLELGNEQAEEIDAKTEDLELELTKTGSQAAPGDWVAESTEDAKFTPKGLFRTVGKFLYEQRQHKILYALTIISAAVGGGVYAMQAYLFANIIKVFQYQGQKLLDQGNFWALMFFVLALCVLVAYQMLCTVANHISTYVATTYRQEYFESILAKPIQFYDQEGHSSGTLTSRLSTDPEQLREILGVNMAFPLIALFNITGSVAISFAFGWKLSLVALFAATPVILAAAFMRVRYEIQFEALNAKVFAHSSQFAAESIKAIRTVTSLTLEHSILDRYDELLKEHVHKAFLRARLAVLVFALADSIELLVTALGFWYGGQLLGSREYDVVQFFVIYTALVQGGQAAGQFLSFGPNIAKATAAANRILSFRDAKSSLDKQSSSVVGNPLTDAGAKDGVKIEFNGVSFKYPTRDIPVFRSLTLSISPGQFVAFVGPSGCGKTTIISLLERFYDITSGSITLDDMDIRSLPAAKYRQPIALVSQEPTLFEGTIRSNLLLGIPSHTPTPSDDEIHAAASAASLHTFITSLPEGYNTPVSATSHGSLSGGQKQRLCIARALLRKPRLLLLDEATSSLDSQSERDVQAALEKVVEGRQMTVCVVAHRLATVQRADRIFVLGEGEGRGARVLEQGTHKELVGRRGTYWAMVSVLDVLLFVRVITNYVTVSSSGVGSVGMRV